MSEKRRAGAQNIVEDSVPRDLLNIFFDQMGEYDLLTPEEETALAWSMVEGRRAGETLADLNGEASAEQIGQLSRDHRQGLIDRAELIASNLRLVVHNARPYLGHGYGLADLVQWGSVGLVRAVDKFDPAKGFKLSTYATKWIRQEISRGIRLGNSPIKVSYDTVIEVRALQTTRDELGKEHIDREVIEESGARLSPERIAGALLALSVDSLDFVPRDNDTPVQEYLRQDGDTDGMDKAETTLHFKQTMTLLLEQVRKREFRSKAGKVTVADGEMVVRVLELRYGLNGHEPMKLEEIGQTLGGNRDWAYHVAKFGTDSLRRAAEELGLSPDELFEL